MKAILQGQKVSGLPSGGTTGQVLTKTETGSSWQDAIKELPENGTTGQILEKTATGTQWTDKPSLPSCATVTLTTSGWSSNTQTVTVSGVVADTNAQAIDMSPVSKIDADNWAQAGVWCTAQGINTLTFTCAEVPSANINVNVKIQEVGA